MAALTSTERTLEEELRRIFSQRAEGNSRQALASRRGDHRFASLVPPEQK